MFNMVMLIVTVFNKFSITLSPEEKMHEGFVEREFRLRQGFQMDMKIYQMFISAGGWLSLKFIMQVCREEYRLEEAMKEKRD